MTQLNELRCSAATSTKAPSKRPNRTLEPARETRELSVNRNTISSREQLRLQTTPKGRVHSNTSQLRW